jgi:hypothetical protein
MAYDNYFEKFSGTANDAASQYMRNIQRQMEEVMRAEMTKPLVWRIDESYFPPGHFGKQQTNKNKLLLLV